MWKLDKFLANIIDQIPSKKYSLIYATSPKELQKIEEESLSYSFEDSVFQESFHSEFKRDFSDYAQAEDDPKDSSLFRKYQFLTAGTHLTLWPWEVQWADFVIGIFMGGIALFVFLTILYIAISALLSLKVSYAAFEKDTAPGSQAQKKQQ